MKPAVLLLVPYSKTHSTAVAETGDAHSARALCTISKEYTNLGEGLG